MERELRVVDPTGARTAVVVDAGPGATVGELRAALAEALGVPAGALWRGATPLADGVGLAEAGLVAGVEVGLGASTTPPGDDRRDAPPGTGPDAPPATGPDAPPGTAAWEVAAVGGPAASPRIGAGAGATVRIGRGDGADLVVDDPEVSRDHAALVVTDDGAGAAVTDAGSRNGVRWRGYRLVGEADLVPGDVVQVGETVVGFRAAEPPVTLLGDDTGEGVRRFNRPPRIRPDRAAPELTRPVAPEKPKNRRFPLATLLLPLLLAGVLYAVLPNAGYYLVFLALMPLMLLANVVSDRRGGRKEYAEKKKAYDEAVAGLEETLRRLVAQEERDARDAQPDPAAVLHRATTAGARLWERRPADADFLRLRVGLADRPSAVRLLSPSRDQEPVGPVVPPARLVPAVLDLPTLGVAGIAGPREAVLRTARAVLAAAATAHAPDELGILLLTGRDEASAWEWLTWLPHTLPGSSAWRAHRLVGTDAAQAEARLTELRALVAGRADEQRSALAGGPPRGRRYLVVLDGARRLRALPGVADLLRDGPAVGVHALCLDTDAGNLPDECRATVVVDADARTRGTLRTPLGEPVEDVLLDGVSEAAAARLAVALAPVRRLGAAEGADGGLPERVRFLDLAGLPDVTPDDVRARWAASPGGRSTTALLGTGPSGPLTVDLRRDGPHGLVAGTSGSGKSELLQTFVASLALGNAPDALTFVLVDYKGGAAFADCARLPHCVGLVTDLDGHLVTRALDSLSAELKRREGLLAAAGAKDVEDYWARTGARLPRLVIVVDEFASLVEEVPEFVPGVVGIGMRGRSLGVHVVLATQRPGGVVSAELRANLNLRVSLRVTSAAESSDVVDAPDAVRIAAHQPGRAYLRTGHTELTPFQAARVGGPRPAAGERTEQVRVAVRRVADLGLAPGREGADAGTDGEDVETDLRTLVDAVRAAADGAGVPAPASPWLPALPDLVPLAMLPDAAVGPGVGVLGLADRPRQQAQDTFTLDLPRLGTVALAGTVRSGRSSALRTLAATLAAGAGPADLHLYVIDCGRALSGLVGLPHCGAVVDGDDTARLERLVALLDAEVDRRARVLAAGGHASVAEQRAASAAPDRLPHLVLLLDRLEAFTARYGEVDGGRLVDALERLLRRGPGAGLGIVLSTDRTGFGHRIASTVESRLVLRQADRDSYSVFGLDPRTVPGRMPPGRAVWSPTGEEVQVGLLSADPAGTAQADALDRVAAGLRRRWDGTPADLLPRRVDPLPDEVTLDEVAALADLAGLPGAGLAVDGPAGGDLAGGGAGVAGGLAGGGADGDGPETGCLLGVGGDELTAVALDLADADAFVVAGPPRSGRSTALVTIVRTLAGREAGTLPVVLVAPRPSPLRSLADLPGVLAVLDRPAEVGAALDDLLAEHADRLAVVIDDAELLADGPAAARLERFARQARDAGGVLVVAATTEDLLLQRYRGWLATARRARTGLLLDPASAVDGEAFDLRLPRSTAGGWPAGRGLLVRRGATATVQVARAVPVPATAP